MNTEGVKILKKIKQERDFVPKSREILADLDPISLTYYHELFMHVRNNRKKLSPKMMEIIFVAINAAQLYERGLAPHMRSAFKEGAEPHEILDALLAAFICSGICALSVSLPILDEVMKDLGYSKSSG